jgi:hypothetical protein
VLVLLLLLGALLTSMHAYVVNYGENRGMRKERHERILSMTGEAPWAYRVLSPALAEGTARVVGPRMARPIDRRESGYLLWRLVWTSGFLVAFHRLLERWLPPTWALLGAVLVAALHGPSYLHYWYQPDSPGDLFAWTLAALLTVQGRDRWLFPLMVIAALNPNMPVVLVESRARRVEFLQRVIETLKLTKCRVEGQRLERVTPFPARAISARAFAPLPKLLELSAPFSTRATAYVLPKGRSAGQELEALKPSIRAMFHVKHSLTDPEAGIIGKV